MSPTTTAVGASVLAHGLHITLLLLGLWGLAALMLPHTLERLGHGDHHGLRALDAHETRVRALRAAVDDGTLAVLRRPVVAPAPPVVAARTGTAATLTLPIAVVGSGAAAGIHAAVAPPHLEESLLFGLFFTVTALAQLAWAAAAWARPTHRLLEVGVGGNIAVLVLWGVTRTVGLPFDLLPTPEAVGGWDVGCAAWEVVVVLAALRLLAAGPAARTLPRRAPSWSDWHPAARGALGLAGFSLALLSLMGGHS